MTRMVKAFCAAGALLAITMLTPVAYADGRDYNDGPVVNVTLDPHRTRLTNDAGRGA